MKKRIVLCTLVLVLLAVQAAFAASARKLNSDGFDLYEQGRYEEALELFRMACEADETYPYAHYNYACTSGILMTKDVCMYLDLYHGLDHLQKAVQLNPKYKTKMRSDPDLAFYRQYYWFYMLAGYDMNSEGDLLEVLTSITWYGPKPGVTPANPTATFVKDNSVKIGIIDPKEWKFIYYPGTFTLTGKTIRIRLERELKGRKEFEAEFRDGRIFFKDEALDTLSDDPGLCEA